MKGNRHIRLQDDRRAQVGIGTMIVFIATILVAATAAALLIDTSGKLQERSSKTGEEATKEVSSNLIMKSVYGDRTSTATGLQRLNVTVSLAPGASAVDLSNMIVKYSDGQAMQDFTYSQANATNYFMVAEIRDPKGTFTAASPVMSAGALVNLQINLATSDTGILTERQDVTMFLIPEVGTAVQVAFASPASFGTDLVVLLR